MQKKKSTNEFSTPETPIIFVFQIYELLPDCFNLFVIFVCLYYDYFSFFPFPAISNSISCHFVVFSSLIILFWSMLYQMCSFPIHLFQVFYCLIFEILVYWAHFLFRFFLSSKHLGEFFLFLYLPPQFLPTLSETGLVFLMSAIWGL